MVGPHFVCRLSGASWSVKTSEKPHLGSTAESRLMQTKGKLLKQCEIVAYKKKEVKERGGGGRRTFFSPAASIYKWEKNPLNFLLLS